MLKRCLVCLILLLAVWSGEAWYYLSDRPFQGSHDAIAALNGGDAEANRLRVNEAAKNIPTLIGAGLSVLVVVGCFIDLYWYAEVPRLRREGHENEKHS